MTSDNQLPPDEADVASRIVYISSYADAVNIANATASDAQDRDTIEVAKTIFWLHRSRVWVQESTPRPATDRDKGGRLKEPGSEAAFCRYIKKEAKLSATYTKRLLKAGRWMESFGHLVPETAKFSGERALHPLIDLDNRADLREDEMKRAVEESIREANGKPITAEHTKIIARNMLKDSEVNERVGRIASKTAKNADPEKIGAQIEALLAKLGTSENGLAVRQRIADSLIKPARRTTRKAAA